MINKIVLHHTASDADALTWEQIRDYHVKVKGWDDIGYHWGIVKDGLFYSVVPGRTEETIGAHAKGFNARTIGVAFEGNFELKEMCLEQFQLGVQHVYEILKRYKLPVSAVVGHRELPYPTLCPGRKFPLNAFRGSLSDIFFNSRSHSSEEDYSDAEASDGQEDL